MSGNILTRYGVPPIGSFRENAKMQKRMRGAAFYYFYRNQFISRNFNSVTNNTNDSYDIADLPE